MPFAAKWMGLESVILSEVRQRQRNIIWHTLYVKFKKKVCKWTHKTKRLTDLENERMVVGGGGEGIVREFGKVMYTLLYSKWITNKDLLYSTWNSTKCYVPAWTGEGYGGKRIHIYVWLSLFTVHLKLPEHC